MANGCLTEAEKRDLWCAQWLSKWAMRGGAGQGQYRCWCRNHSGQQGQHPSHIEMSINKSICVHAINAIWIIKIKVKRKHNKGSATFMTGKRETQALAPTKRLPWHASKTRYATPEISAAYSSPKILTHTTAASRTHTHTHVRVCCVFTCRQFKIPYKQASFTRQTRATNKFKRKGEGERKHHDTLQCGSYASAWLVDTHCV